jgi:putative endonuclease
LRGGFADVAIQKEMKRPAIYIMTNKRNGTLYTGVTSNLVKRVYEHKEGVVPGFTKNYDCKQLVYYETHESMDNAITREKQIKSGSRDKKLALIESMNPEWNDLYEEII